MHSRFWEMIDRRCRARRRMHLAGAAQKSGDLHANFPGERGWSRSACNSPRIPDLKRHVLSRADEIVTEAVRLPPTARVFFFIIIAVGTRSSFGRANTRQIDVRIRRRLRPENGMRLSVVCDRIRFGQTNACNFSRKLQPRRFLKQLDTRYLLFCARIQSLGFN